jgi:hypothetical protein
LGSDKKNKSLDQWPLLIKTTKFFWGAHKMFISTLKSFGCQLWRSKVGDQIFFVNDYGN